MAAAAAAMAKETTFPLTTPLSLFLFLSLFLSSLSALTRAARNLNENQIKGANNSIGAILVFGDSTVDPGNNNYITTILKCDFPPYGKDYFQQRPTGRFTNGRLLTDFLASYVGLKDAIPPYLDKTLSKEELLTGVSFASAGSGYDPLTPKITGVIDLPKQLDYFREYKKTLEDIIGKERTDDLIKQSAVVVSAGTNDFIINYFGLKIRKQKYTTEEYQLLILQKFREFIEGLWELGLRKIAVANLPPFGCLPIVRTIYQRGSHPGCLESFNIIAQDYNLKLQAEIAAMQNKYEGGIFVYGDMYSPIADMVLNPAKYGFWDSTDGCCGTGLLEVSFLCTSKLIQVCPDASKYVFFDSVHPTERAYYVMFDAVRGDVDKILRS